MSDSPNMHYFSRIRHTHPLAILKSPSNIDYKSLMLYFHNLNQWTPDSSQEINQGKFFVHI